MSYANSDQSLWDNWFDLIEPLISQTPLHVAAGNHEIECDLATHLPFKAYENRFWMPNRVAEARVFPVDESYFNDPYGCSTPSVFLGSYDFGNSFYAFTYGLVRWIILSSYSDTTVGSEQYQWLLRELDTINRAQTPWVVVMMHTQFYTTFHAHNDEIQTTIMRNSMEPLFVKYRINLVISGHDHAYMRTKSMSAGEFDPSGTSPMYVIVGEGGNKEGHVKEYISDNVEEWVAVRDKTVYGFGTLEVVNATSARWKWIMDQDNDDSSFSDDTWMLNQLFL